MKNFILFIGLALFTATQTFAQTAKETQWIVLDKGQTKFTITVPSDATVKITRVKSNRIVIHKTIHLDLHQSTLDRQKEQGRYQLLVTKNNSQGSILASHKIEKPLFKPYYINGERQLKIVDEKVYYEVHVPETIKVINIEEG